MYCILPICAMASMWIIGCRNHNSDDNIKPTNETIGYLDSDCEYSIPRNTQIVATCCGRTGVYAFIVKSVTNEQHYVVYLRNKKVESIPFVDVVSETKRVNKEVKSL